METVEHWWNSLWGTSNRRDVWLRRDRAGPRWEIELRQGGRTARGDYGSEDEARAVLGELVSRGPGTWRRLDVSSFQRRPDDGPTQQRDDST